VPDPPDAARALFGESLPLALRYAELLAGPGVERGLLGPGEKSRIWDRHLLNSAAVAELIIADGEVIDLGSGAGLPGIVLAILLPRSTFTLVEPMERRTAFLGECVAELGLANVEIRRGRAEDLAGRIAADTVTSRAVARLDRLAVLATGLAKPGGQVLAIKGANAASEVEQAEPVLRRLGVSDVGVVVAGAGILAQPTTVVRFSTRSEAGRALPKTSGKARAARRR
jgi:16S rRNA (guanine527-N7)-methyltransferase